MASAIAALLPQSSDRGDEAYKEEESWQRKRMGKQDERRHRAIEERAERRRMLASKRASEQDAEPAIPVPKHFIVLQEVIYHIPTRTYIQPFPPICTPIRPLILLNDVYVIRIACLI